MHPLIFSTSFYTWLFGAIFTDLFLFVFEPSLWCFSLGSLISYRSLLYYVFCTHHLHFPSVNMCYSCPFQSCHPFNIAFQLKMAIQGEYMCQKTFDCANIPDWLDMTCSVLTESNTFSYSIKTMFIGRLYSIAIYSIMLTDRRWAHVLSSFKIPPSLTGWWSSSLVY